MVQRGFLLLSIVLLTFPLTGFSQAKAASRLIGSSSAAYSIRVLSLDPPRFAVTASVPISGKLLEMDQSWSLDVPEVDSKGWPALIRDLRVTDLAGHAIEAVTVGGKGWELVDPYQGTLKLEYEVDFSGPAAKNWPAPRETAFRDPNHFLFIGRSVFITSQQTRSAAVEIRSPAGWFSVTPWRSIGPSRYSVESRHDLIANMLVLTDRKPRSISAGGFSVSVTALGHWEPLMSQIDEVVRKVIPRLVQTVGHIGQGKYSIILLPINDSGGESYRGSFVYNVVETPSTSDRNEWGRLFAHEIFHYWNGWRLRGKDYASTQWFQEGFTDYTADLAMLNSEFVDRKGFLSRLNQHLKDYRKLSTPLAAPGTRKGRPLYSGGALVAFCWDIWIRHETQGKRNIGDLFRGLWLRTIHGDREYAWTDIRSVLSSTAAGDWDTFYKKHIEGQEPLPLAEILPLAGLRLSNPGPSEMIEMDPAASSRATQLLNRLVTGRP